MAARTSWALNQTAAFNVEDAASAEVALDDKSLGFGLLRIVGKPISEVQSKQETPFFAKSNERHALRNSRTQQNKEREFSMFNRFAVFTAMLCAAVVSSTPKLTSSAVRSEKYRSRPRCLGGRFGLEGRLRTWNSDRSNPFSRSLRPCTSAARRG